MLESNRKFWRGVILLMVFIVGTIFLYEDKLWEAAVCFVTGLLGLFGVNIFAGAPLDKRLDKLSPEEIATVSKEYKRTYVREMIFGVSLAVMIAGILCIVVLLLPDAAGSRTSKLGFGAFCAFMIGLGSIGCWKFCDLKR